MIICISWSGGTWVRLELQLSLCFGLSVNYIILVVVKWQEIDRKGEGSYHSMEWEQFWWWLHMVDYACLKRDSIILCCKVQQINKSMNLDFLWIWLCSFEQFCINYCNERLQQMFINLVLRKEQEVYSSEGVEWVHISFRDNAPIYRMIEV